MRKALIITYYWPPSGGAGVQRWLKFVKYLREFGWEPVIYTPSNPGYSVLDDTLSKDIPSDIEIIKKPIWEPYTFYKRFTSKKDVPSTGGEIVKEKKSSGIIKKFSIWVRGNIFIPDARKFWIKPSIRFLVKYLKNNPADLIISTGPPHSMHLIALQLKAKLNIPWLADFRDPWTDIDYYKEMKVSAFSHRRHQKLEIKTITHCDALVVVSQSMKDNYEKMGGKNIHIITNGFDPADIGMPILSKQSKFSISHIGTLPPAFNMNGLWLVLKDLCDSLPGFKENLEIKLIGNVDNTVEREIIANDLGKHLILPGYVSHAQAASLMKQSSVLLVVINHNSPNAKGILTGKIFEYLATGRPVLAIGPTDGDLANILEDSQAGNIALYDDFNSIKEIVTEFYRRYLINEPGNNTEKIKKYTRRFLTGKLAEVMNKLPILH